MGKGIKEERRKGEQIDSTTEINQEGRQEEKEEEWNESGKYSEGRGGSTILLDGKR